MARWIRRFYLTNCNPPSVSDDPHSRFLRDSSSPQDATFPYREAVGSLMFAAMCTREDNAFAVSQGAQFSSQPNQIHWEAVKRIIAYLKKTSEHGITYREGDGILTYSIQIKTSPEMSTLGDQHQDTFFF